MKLCKSWIWGLGVLLAMVILWLQESAVRASEDSFAPYYFRTVGSCSVPNTMRFQLLVSEFTNEIGQDIEGRPILLGARLSLFPDQSVILLYREYVVLDGNNIRDLYSSVVLGRWERFPVQQQLDFKLESGVFFGHLVLTGISNGGNRMLGLFIDEGVGRPAAQNKMLGLFLEENSTGPRGESAEEFCRGRRPS